MNVQHLSDEAIAAFADGVLGGHARDRAARHIAACAECRAAVKVQREAAFALRSACAPSLPAGLVDRLRSVPLTTPLASAPTALDSDGTPMLSTFAPMAALVPEEQHRGSRVRPYVTTAAVLALAGVLAAGSVGMPGSSPQGGTGQPVRHAKNDFPARLTTVQPALLFHGYAP